MLILEPKPLELQENSFSANCSGENQLAVACRLWEEATDMLLQAGRILSRVKDNTKRNFTKLISEAGLEKSQVTKLVKLASVADEIPTVVARRLGVNMLSQLAQPKNNLVLETIEPSDNQKSVAQKIKENRPPSTLTSKEGVKLIGKKGKERLRIDIPGCVQNRDIYEEFKKTGLSPLEWLQNLRNNQPTLEEVLEQEVNSSILELPDPWKAFPQKWQHEGKNCLYDLVDGEKVIHWDGYQTKISDNLAVKYINPRTFLDFELVTPGALVKIDVQRSGGDKTWNDLPAYVQEIKNNKVKVCLQGDYREKFFSVNDLRTLEPSPVNWERN